MCHPWHVYRCQKPHPCQRSEQRGVLSIYLLILQHPLAGIMCRYWGWSRCASGICSQPLAFHTCAGSSDAPVPYWCAMGASVCQRPCCNGRLTWRMHCKVEGMERKGLGVNMKKTKFIVLGPGLDLLCDSGAFPYAICHSGVGVNSIQCSQCMYWAVIHLQFWAYGFWDSLFPISMSPNCKLMSPEHCF